VTFQPEKSKDSIVIYVATKGAGLQLGNFIVDQITQDFVQTAALKFSERLTSELGAPVAHASLVESDAPRERTIAMGVIEATSELMILANRF
jgi:hypothetical protein